MFDFEQKIFRLSGYLIKWWQKLKILGKFFEGSRRLFREVCYCLYNFVLYCFQNINHKVRSKFPFERIKEETEEHVSFMLKLFKKVIFPLSLFYALAGILLGENVLDSLTLAVILFFYSNFAPDLPAALRRKDSLETSEKRELPWYKKCGLLLFAPIFVYLLFKDWELSSWRTFETFHSFKWLSVYGLFLLTLSLYTYSYPIEIFPPVVYGLLGYLAHLKVDKIW